MHKIQNEFQKSLSFPELPQELCLWIQHNIRQIQTECISTRHDVSGRASKRKRMNHKIALVTNTLSIAQLSTNKYEKDREILSTYQP